MLGKLGNITNTSTYPRATKVLEKYRNYVVQQAKSNLSKGGDNGAHKASGTLYKSIRGYINKKFNRSLQGRFTGGSSMPSLTFEMKGYGAYLDKGVKGAKSNYIENRTSPYKFRGNKKMVNTKSISKWVKAKGLSENLTFAIARSVYNKGIKRTLFFTKPFEKRLNITLFKYHKAIADDIANNFANQIAKQLKQRKKLNKKK